MHPGAVTILLAGNPPNVTVEQVSVWWFVLPPIAAVLLSTIGVYLAVSRDRRDRDQDQEARDEDKARREERLDHTADAVLGSEGDWRRGRTKIVGLLEKLDNQDAKIDRLVATVGHVNGHGKSVMDHIRDINDNVARIGRGQLDAAHELEQHQAEDARNFSEINLRLQDLTGGPR